MMVMLTMMMIVINDDDDDDDDDDEDLDFYNKIQEITKGKWKQIYIYKS